MSTVPYNIDDLREQMRALMEGVISGTIDVARARAGSELCRAITDLQKVEVEHIKATRMGTSAFLAGKEARQPLPNGVVGIRRHLLGDE